MTRNTYELIVVGSGGTGSSTASMGKRIEMIERDNLGATRTNYGCDPTITLLYLAHLLYHARKATAMGLCIPKTEADRAMVQAHVRQMEEFIYGGEPEQGRANIMAQGIDLFIGEATMITDMETAVLLEKPNRVVVIGSGRIGLEFAQMFGRFGVKVVVLEGAKQPAPDEYPELALALCTENLRPGLTS